eukprot:666129-Amphidinium_carterae.2
MATMMEIMEEGEKLEEATTQATVDELTADNEARIEKTEAVVPCDMLREQCHCVSCGSEGCPLARPHWRSA